MFGFKKHINAETSDQDLMKAMLKGQKMAFELLYARYFDKLVWYANGFVQDPFEAQDIVQEVFIQLIESPEKYDTDRIFSTWIYTVTANKAKNKIRTQKAKQDFIKTHHYLNENALAHLHHEVDMQELLQHLNQIYNGLTEKEKQVFVLRFDSKKSIKDIATAMAIPEGSVKSCIYYMLKKYNGLLKQYNYEL